MQYFQKKEGIKIEREETQSFSKYFIKKSFSKYKNSTNKSTATKSLVWAAALRTPTLYLDTIRHMPVESIA
jgi:hypothetical protein